MVVLEIADDSQELCPLTKPTQTRNEIWPKPSQKSSWEQRVVLKSTLLGGLGFYFGWHSVFVDRSDFSRSLSAPFPLSRRREGAGFPWWGPSPSGWCGVKGADVAPLCANNIWKLRSFWLGCKVEPFQESAPGPLKYELLENKLHNKGQIVISFPPGKPWTSPLLFEHLRKCILSSEQQVPQL